MNFYFSAIEPKNIDAICWYLFKGPNLLVKKSLDQVAICKFKNPDLHNLQISRPVYFGTHGKDACYCAEITNDVTSDEFELKELRKLFGVLSDDEFSIASRAYQIVNWDLTHAFCGKCGTAMTPASHEFAKICSLCNHTVYPRISPAIIVAIVRDGKILLARRADFQMYSVIAGYVDPGERLEETVAREAMEEVGIKVKNIQYFSSQPWAFSYTLMVAFTAEYESGEIVPDGKEISEAYWFSSQELPDTIPGNLSIARALIDWFKSKY